MLMHDVTRQPWAGSMGSICIRLAGLVAYCHQPKKPSLHINLDLELVPAV